MQPHMQLSNNVILSQQQFLITSTNFLYLALLFFWIISRQVILTNGLGSVQSNYTGRGLTSNMPLPEGPCMCVHACVGVLMRDNKSKTKNLRWRMRVCVCALSWPMDRQRQITLCPALAPPPHFQKVNLNKRQMASLALSSIMTTPQLGKQMYYKIICLFRQCKDIFEFSIQNLLGWN